MSSPHWSGRLRGCLFALLAAAAGILPVNALYPRSSTTYGDDGSITFACVISVPLVTRVVTWTSIAAGLVVGAGLWRVASGRRVPALPLFAAAALPFAVAVG